MGSSDERIEAWRLLLQTHAAVLRAIERDLARAGHVPLTWYDVLLELNAAPRRRLRMQELSNRVVLSRTRVSRLVDEMAANDLVVKEPDEQDRRSTFTVLTATGRTALRRAAPVYLDAIERHFTRHLGDRRRAAIIDALRTVLAAQDVVEGRGRSVVPRVR